MMSAWESERTIAWTKDDPAGAEVAHVTVAPGRLRASGVAIGSDPLPYRLDYELETMTGFITTRAQVQLEATAGAGRCCSQRSGAGGWTHGHQADGGPPARRARRGPQRSLGGALDPDLGLSPLFNTMPVLRASDARGRAPPPTC